MKRIFKLTVSFVCIYAIQACSKSDSVKINETVGDDLNFVKIELASSREEQILMFNQLTSSEKFNLWMRHIKLLEKNSATNLTIEQKNLILQLKTILKPSIFEDNSKDNLVFKNYNFPLWLSKAESAFSKIELYNLLARVSKKTNTVMAFDLEYLEGPDGVNCWCNQGTNGFSCTKVHIGIPNTGVEYGVCVGGNQPCNISNGGCGFLWLSSCNGNSCQF
jgi:hypothetical protein